MNYLALMKLLYLADREALLRFGRPITGDRVVAMKHGPVLSRVYDLVSRQKRRAPQSEWHKFIPRPQPYVFTVAFSGPLDTSELSEAELALIDEIYARFRGWNEWDLVAYTQASRVDRSRPNVQTDSVRGYPARGQQEHRRNRGHPTRGGGRRIYGPSTGCRLTAAASEAGRHIPGRARSSRTTPPLAHHQPAQPSQQRCADRQRQHLVPRGRNHMHSGPRRTAIHQAPQLRPLLGSPRGHRGPVDRCPEERPAETASTC